MTTFPLLNPGRQAPVGDGVEEISGPELALRVAQVKDRLAAGGLTGRRICLAMDAGLGAIAVLIAALETGTRAALIPRPARTETPDWPAFCDAVAIPPEPGQPIGDLTLLVQEAGPDPAPGDRGRIWLRSSGTTGTPKWVLHDTPRLYANAAAAGARLGLTGQDRVLIPVPVNHMFGFGAAFLPALQAGAAIRLAARGNPLVIFQAQRSFQPTAMFLVPSQCRSIMALGRKAGRARLIVVAGDRLAAAEAAAFEADHGRLVNLYGSTEMGAISAGHPDGPAALRHLTAGPPVANVRLAIDSPTDPDPAAEGALPMRMVHGAGFLGYCDPVSGALTAPAPDLWPTGDLVRLHPVSDGGDAPWIEVMGRADHAVNRDGLLVHLGQIEGVLARAPGVALSAVVAAGQSRRGMGLAAFVTLTRAQATTPDDLLAACRAELPARAVPDVLHVLAEMPMLASGKVDRRRLAALAAEKAAAQG